MYDEIKAAGLKITNTLIAYKVLHSVLASDDESSHNYNLRSFTTKLDYSHVMPLSPFLSLEGQNSINDRYIIDTRSFKRVSYGTSLSVSFQMHL